MDPISKQMMLMVLKEYLEKNYQGRYNKETLSELISVLEKANQKEIDKPKVIAAVKKLTDELGIELDIEAEMEKKDDYLKMAQQFLKSDELK
jgi:iron-sulfur cluster repair protein YtfE (RIC family)